MRVTPLAIWTSKLTHKEILKAVSQDARMTHPSTVVQEANFLYCAAI